MNDEDVRELLKEEDLQKYTHISLNSALDDDKNMSWCPTADCNYAFFFEPGNGPVQLDSNEEMKDEVVPRQGFEFDCPKC